MSVTRHAPDPTHQRETLCGHAIAWVGVNAHRLVGVGEVINCFNCRVTINMALKCVSPSKYMLVRTP